MTAFTVLTCKQLEVFCHMTLVNSLPLGRCGNNFENVISEHILRINLMCTSCEITMPKTIFGDKSTLGYSTESLPDFVNGIL